MSRVLVRSLFVFFAALLAILGPAPAAPVPTHLVPKEPSTLFPTSVGTKSVYDTPDGDRVEVITKVEERGGAKLVTVESVDGTGKTSPCRKLSVSQKGVFLVKGNPFLITQGEGGYENPWCILPTTLKAEDRWRASATLEGGGALTATTRVIGRERVKVPAGTFNTTRIEWKFSLDPGPKDVLQSYWYAPEIGLIQVGDPPSWTLKAFAPGR